MKILYYLPAITPWWFSQMIAPMLRNLHGQAEQHVIVAPTWHKTGLDIEHVEPLVDLTDINWHVVCPDDPFQFRVDGAQVEGLLDLVHAIDADLTLARSADRKTPQRFPGTVRHLTEPGAEPLRAPHRWLVLDEQPFHHGMMPPQTAEAADRAAQLIAPAWDELHARFANPGYATQRAMLDLPTNRPVLAVPLQYEHAENLYGVGSPFQFGPEFIRELLDQLDPRIMLAITDHPLNQRFLMRHELDRIAAEFPDRVRLYPYQEGRMSPTNMLIRTADAVLIDQSKCVWLAGFFGTPIVHVGDSVMADWMNATPLANLSAKRMVHRGLPAPDPAMARRWFGWHYGTRPVDPRTVTPERLLAHVLGTVTPDEAAAYLETIQQLFKNALNAADVQRIDLMDRAEEIRDANRRRLVA